MRLSPGYNRRQRRAMQGFVLAVRNELTFPLGRSVKAAHYVQESLKRLIKNSRRMHDLMAAAPSPTPIPTLSTMEGAGRLPGGSSAGSP